MRLSTLLILLLVVGCDRSPLPAGDAPRSWQHYASLPGLSRSQHTPLQTELVLLREEKATPAQLAAQAGFDISQTPKKWGTPDPPDPRVALRNAYPPMSRSVLRQRLERIDAYGTLHFGPVETEDLRQLLRQTDGNRERFRGAAALCRQKLRINPAEGVLVDLDFVEPIQIGCHVELLAAADGVAHGRLTQAVETVDSHLALAQRLAGEPNTATRLAAAELRRQTLRLLQLVVTHPKLLQDDLARCRTLIDSQLKSWPSDAIAWTGDRAAGLQVYELVRDGHYLSLLDRQEVERMEGQGLVQATGRAVLRGVDGDEHFYLTAMRRMIAGCELPYFARRELLQQIRTDLVARRDTPAGPLVADKLLLTDFELAHQRQAEDLARCEAWALAFRVAAGEPSPLNVNPLTGQPFQIEVIDRQLIVSQILPDDANYRIVVPMTGQFDRRSAAR